MKWTLQTNRLVGLAAVLLSFLATTSADGQEKKAIVVLKVTDQVGKVRSEVRREVTAGDNAFDVMRQSASVGYTTFPELGAFVTTINGFSLPEYYYWSLFVDEAVVESNIGISQIVLKQGVTTLEWRATKTSFPNPAPKPPVRVSLTVRDKDKNVLVQVTRDVPGGTNLLDMMRDVARVEYKTVPEYEKGKLKRIEAAITNSAGVAPADGQVWNAYVDGTLVEGGASQAKLDKATKIELRLENK